MLKRAYAGPVGLAVALLCASAGLSSSRAADAGSQLEVGNTLDKAIDLTDPDMKIPLPEGRWKLGGLVKDIDEQAGDYVSGIVTRTEGGKVTGLIWFRTTNREDFESLADWCDSSGARRAVEQIRLEDVDRACRWLRTWNTRPGTTSLDEEWRSTFDSLQERGTTIPEGMTTAGFHIVDGKRSRSIEYSFDSAEVSEEQVARWARAWQDYMAAAVKRQLAEMPQTRPSPLD